MTQTPRKPGKGKTSRPAPATAPSETANDAIGDVEEVLKAAQQDRGDMIWMWRQAGGQFAYLEACTPLTLQELGVRETVRRRFGGGRFRARLRFKSGKWGVSRDFTIEGQSKTPNDSPAPIAVVPAPSSSSSADMPGWVKQLLVPIVATLGTALAKRLMEPAAKNDVDTLELQRLLLEAETRGERRGRDLGEMSAQLEAASSRRGTGDGSASGVLAAVREAVPVVHRMLDAAQNNRRRRLVEQSPAPSPAPATGPAAADSPPTDIVPDIVPAWLRPFIAYKTALLSVADRGKSAQQYADMIVDQVEDDEQLLTALVEANGADRLLADLKAAVPEIAASAKREQFALELVKAIQEALQELTVDGTDAPAAPSSEAANG